jgi:hypothetical protein
MNFFKILAIALWALLAGVFMGVPLPILYYTGAALPCNVIALCLGAGALHLFYSLSKLVDEL